MSIASPRTADDRVAKLRHEERMIQLRKELEAKGVLKGKLA